MHSHYFSPVISLLFLSLRFFLSLSLARSLSLSPYILLSLPLSPIFLSPLILLISLSITKQKFLWSFPTVSTSGFPRKTTTLKPCLVGGKTFASFVETKFSVFAQLKKMKDIFFLVICHLRPFL